jgi:hypothetical protein
VSPPFGIVQGGQKPRSGDTDCRKVSPLLGF